MTKHHPRRRRGFTLLEVLLVVGILVALAAIALPGLIGVQAGAQIDEARLQVGALEKAFQTYFVHNGSFPTTEQGLAALVSVPNPPPRAWRGPYLDNPNPTDPWGMPYRYQFPPTRNPNNGVAAKPDIWSDGPDRQSGTSDDIGNWPTGTQ